MILCTRGTVFLTFSRYSLIVFPPFIARQMSARASTAAACFFQLSAPLLAVRCPANVCSCEHGSRLLLPALSSAARCPLPGKCLLVRARQPLAGPIAQKNGVLKGYARISSLSMVPTLALPKSGGGSKRFIFLSACLIRKLPVFSYVF